jgi:hypothetical protein
LCCVIALAGGACGGGSNNATATTTTAAPVTTTTIAFGKYKTPLDAANALMLAWKNSDGEAAARAAKREAVLTLFGRTYAQHQQRGCDAPGQLGSDCNYRLAGAGGVRLHVIADPAAGFLVESATFID